MKFSINKTRGDNPTVPYYARIKSPHSALNGMKIFITDAVEKDNGEIQYMGYGLVGVFLSPERGRRYFEGEKNRVPLKTFSLFKNRKEKEWIITPEKRKRNQPVQKT